MQETPRTKIRSTKSEIRNESECSKNRKFQTTAIWIRRFGFSPVLGLFGCGLFRSAGPLWCFGFRILFRWFLGAINFLAVVLFNISEVRIYVQRKGDFAMQTKARGAIGVIAVTVFLLLAGITPQARAQQKELPEVSMLTAVPNFAFAAIWVAEQLKYFEQEGVRIKITPAPGLRRGPRSA